jgi:beta-1,4-N-acetylglucosaminyltransferase
MLWTSLVILLALRALWLALKGWPKSSNLMLILGSGGHTAEMCQLLKTLRLDEFTRVDFVLASNDVSSIPKLQTEVELPAKAQFHRIIRSRNVGQSYFTSVFTTLLSFFPALWVLLATNPGMIISNGPGTSIPVLYSAYALRLLLIRRPKLMFMESFCRVTSLSWTGKLARPISDFFYVQWPQLKQQYPRAKYVGLLS